MALLQEIIVAARNIRAEMKLDPKAEVAAQFGSGDRGLCSDRCEQQPGYRSCGLAVSLPFRIVDAAL